MKKILKDFLDWAESKGMAMYATHVHDEVVPAYFSANSFLDEFLKDYKIDKQISISEIVEACVVRSSASDGFAMPPTIPISYWGMAMMGEGGELCNLLAKKERVKAGAVDGGNSIAVEDISKEKLAEEIAGVFIYLAILSDKLGIDLEKAVVTAFNEKSDKIGYPVHLGENRIINDTEGQLGAGC